MIGGSGQAGKPPLSTIRVVEIADSIAGEFAAQLLAGLGADILKVEGAGGSSTRATGPFAKGREDSDHSLNFWYYNSDKRSAVLDIAADGAGFERLLTDADILVTSQSPAELAQLGLALDELERRFPLLIILSVTPFGLTGPWADYKSSELVAMALGGPLNSCGYDDHSIPPINPGGPQSSHCAASFASIGVMLALVERQASGRGQIVDISMHDATAMNIENANPFWFYPRVPVQRQTCRHAQPSPTQPAHFLCADGRYVYYTLILSEQKAWKGLVAWMDAKGVAAHLTDPAFLDLAYRQAHFDEIQSITECFFLMMTADEAYREGQQAGLPIGVLNAPEDLFDDPHLAARGFFQPVEHEGVGTVRYPGPIYRFSAFDTVARKPAPALGADQAAIDNPWPNAA